ncbi:hypothetical protein Hypma_003173 [Hypsizygus marmoreus]|uniref:Uncharacterized protein n=1 Tax=Hypsizygus marmoreus TaxID=39966 RepID=A0A369K2L6_HYPMA|nr:hypothetical protein Hypma_003173 [Hypsizygus marmoreus]
MAITRTHKRSKVFPPAGGSSSSQTDSSIDVRKVNIKKATKLQASESKASTASQKPKPRKKYELDSEKRKAHLESHPWAGEVLPRNVVCLGCGWSIKTEDSGDYYAYNFDKKHAPGCKNVKQYHALNPHSDGELSGSCAFRPKELTSHTYLLGPYVDMSGLPKGFLDKDTVQAAWILAGMANPNLRILPVPKSRRQ